MTEPEAKEPPPPLPDEMPPMELEQDPSGLWMYHRSAWVGGPEVVKNGVSPGVTVREDAERIVNMLYPGSFPERDAQGNVIEPPPPPPPVE